MKRGTVDHPKTCALAAALALPRWGAVGILESLWHFTAQYAPQGDLGRWDDEAIAQGIGWTGDPQSLIAALVKTRWLDTHTDPYVRLLVHDWNEHADQGVRNRLSSRKEKFIVRGSNPRRTRVEPRSDRGSPGSGSGLGTGSGSSSPDSKIVPTKNWPGFEPFWKVYPRREARADALRAWNKLKPDAAMIAAIDAALAWQRDLPQWREGKIPHPATYLNGGRWLDEPPALRLAGTTARTAGNHAAIQAGLELVRDRR